MAALDQEFELVSSKFNIPGLNPHQKEAIKKIVMEKKDMFINLPTGFGKSLIYQALPLVFDRYTKRSGHIVAVVSPLISLMEDQVKYLTGLGLSAVCLSNVQTEEERLKIEKGEYSIVYGSPEAWLMNERWRAVLCSDVYLSKLCAVAIDEAHVVRQWGTSQDIKKAAFRESYAHLHELRSLAPKATMIALTATATKLTKDTILNILLMENPYEIKESPNKLNVTYVVKCMRKDTEQELYFGWLVDELQSKKESCQRTIIYCQTIKQCGIVYGTIKGMLGKHLFVGTGHEVSVLVEMLHSCTPPTNKQHILSSFQSENGTIRVLIATIAFGMGVDCKGVHRIIHYGPSKNIEAYVQETGRAGRDGDQSIAFILYHGILLNHVEGNMKSFVKTKECRRTTLLKHFDSVLDRPAKRHLCCDNCVAECDCGMSDCGIYATYPVNQSEKDGRQAARQREVTPDAKQHVEHNLSRYHKSLVMKLINTTAKAEVKTLTNLQFMLGFSEDQISQVVDNLDTLFTLSDIFEVVEIWDIKHAQKILSVINYVFGDVNIDNQESGHLPEDNDHCFDDELLDEWNEVLQDDELFDMIVDNLSLSQLESSLIGEELTESNDQTAAGVPSAVLETIETMDSDVS